MHAWEYKCDNVYADNQLAVQRSVKPSWLINGGDFGERSSSDTCI
jgi:hypothetical protein